MQFSEIINLQFGKKCHTLLCILALLELLLLNYLQKMRGYPQFSFLIPIALVKICFSRSHKLRKNTSVLVGTVLNYSLTFISNKATNHNLINIRTGGNEVFRSCTNRFLVLRITPDLRSKQQNTWTLDWC